MLLSNVFLSIDSIKTLTLRESFCEIRQLASPLVPSNVARYINASDLFMRLTDAELYVCMLPI